MNFVRYFANRNGFRSSIDGTTMVYIKAQTLVQTSGSLIIPTPDMVRMVAVYPDGGERELGSFVTLKHAEEYTQEGDWIEMSQDQAAKLMTRARTSPPPWACHIEDGDCTPPKQLCDVPETQPGDAW